MKKIIVFNDYIKQAPIKLEEVEEFKKHNIEYVGFDCENDDDFLKNAKEADIIFDQGHVRIGKKVMNNLSNLKAIVRRGIGYDNIDVKIAASLGISVSNTPGFCTDEVATHALALILSFARKIVQSDRWVKEFKWQNLGDYPAAEYETLCNEEIGIIGFGNNGKQISKMLRSFNSNIIVYDPYIINKKTFKDIEFVELNELLKKSKYIILACSLTEENINMLDDEEFKIMRKDAVIINIARGKLINEKTLIKYLKEKKIAGAALDVFNNEPIPEDSYLLKLNNVILTPHAAGESRKSMDLSLKLSFDEIIRIATKQKILNKVN
jgi:D-3-phosphoglycerate dehydrogenase